MRAAQSSYLACHVACLRATNVARTAPRRTGPDRRKELKRAHKRYSALTGCKNVWIVKPARLQCGEGIFLESDLSKIIHALEVEEMREANARATLQLKQAKVHDGGGEGEGGGVDSGAA
jgi:hypothetical protein